MKVATNEASIIKPATASNAAVPKRHDIPLMEKPFDCTVLMREVAHAASRLA